MKRKQMISFLMASSLSLSSLSVYADGLHTVQEEIKNNIDIIEEEIIEDKPTVLPLLPEDYEEDRPTILPSFPDRDDKGEVQRTIKKNTEGYTVVQYNEGSLKSTINQLGIPFPQKLKIEGTKALTIEDFRYLREQCLVLSNSIDLDLTKALCVNNEIPMDAFRSATNLKSIKLPETITSIGSGAFYESGLTGDLIIPDTVTIIQNDAFRGCNELNGRFQMSKNIEHIGSSAFFQCSNLTGELILPESLLSIGESAFSECSKLTGELTIPSKITRIENGTFTKCRGLTGDLIIPEGVTEIGNGAFSYCSGFNGNLVLPSTLTTIGRTAFAYSNGLTGNLEIPSSVTEIMNEAFKGCSGFNGDLILPSTPVSIRDSAFMECSGLKSVKNYCKTNQVVEQAAFRTGARPKIAYGFSSNSKFKTGVEDESYEWNELDYRVVPVDKEIQFGEKITLNDLVEMYQGEEQISPDRIEQITSFDLNNLEIGDHEIEIRVGYEGYEEVITVNVKVVANPALLEITPIKQTIKHGNPVKIEDLYVATYNGKIVENIAATETDLSRLEPGEHDIVLTFNYMGIQKQSHVTVVVNYNNDLFEVDALKKKTITHGEKLDFSTLFTATYDGKPVPQEELKTRVVSQLDYDIDHLPIGEHRIGYSVEWEGKNGIGSTVWFDLLVAADEKRFKASPVDKTIVHGDPLGVEDLYIASYDGEPLTRIGSTNDPVASLPVGKHEIDVTVSYHNIAQSFISNVTVTPNPDYYDVKPLNLTIKEGKSLNEKDLFKATYKGEPIEPTEIELLTDVDLTQLSVGEYPIEVKVVYEGLEKTVTSTVNVTPNENLFIVTAKNDLTLIHGNTVDLKTFYEATYNGEEVETSVVTETLLETLPLGPASIVLDVSYEEMTKKLPVTLEVVPNDDYFKVTPKTDISITDGESLLLENLFEVTYQEEDVAAESVNQLTDFDLERLPVGTHTIRIEVMYKGLTREIEVEVEVQSNENNLVVSPHQITLTDGEVIDIESLYTASYNNEPLKNIGKTTVDLTNLGVGRHEIPITVSHLGLNKTITAIVIINPNIDDFKLIPQSLEIKDGEIITLNDLYEATYKDLPLGKEMLEARQLTSFNLNALEIGTYQIDLEVTYKGVKKQVQAEVTVTGDETRFEITKTDPSITHGKPVDLEDFIEGEYKGEKVEVEITTEEDLTKLPVGEHEVEVTISYEGMQKDEVLIVTVKPNSEYFTLEATPQTILLGEKIVLEDLFKGYYQDTLLEKEDFDSITQLSNTDLDNLEVGTFPIQIEVVYKGLTKEIETTLIVKANDNRFEVEVLSPVIKHGTSLTVEDLYRAAYDGEVITEIATTEMDLTRLGVGKHLIPFKVAYLGLERDLETNVEVTANEDFFKVKPISQTFKDGETILIETLVDATYDEEPIEVEVELVTDIDLEQLPIGQHEIELDVKALGLSKRVIVNIEIVGNEIFLEATPKQATMYKGKSFSIEKLYAATYKGEPIENIAQTDVDLAKLPVGIHEIPLKLTYAGIEREIISKLTIRNVQTLDEVEQTKPSTPLIPLEPAKISIPMTKLIIPMTKINIPLTKIEDIAQKESEEINSSIIRPSQNNQGNKEEITDKPVQDVVENQNKVESPEIIGNHNTQESKPHDTIQGNQHNTEDNFNNISNNTSNNASIENEEMILENNLEEKDQVVLQEDLILEHQVTDDIQIKEETEALTTEIVLEEESIEKTNAFYEQVKKLFPNMSYETFILLSSSTAFVVIALILVIVVYINKKRKEKDHE